MKKEVSAIQASIKNQIQGGPPGSRMGYGNSSSQPDMSRLQRELKSLNAGYVNDASESGGGGGGTIFSLEKFAGAEFDRYVPGYDDGEFGILLKLKNASGTACERKGPGKRIYHAFNSQTVAIRMEWNGRFFSDPSLV
ncbi:hypothetical protein [Yersinia ruckeri]|uniref:hypothetical protein n=1 Tax=Yersinia ruckeri TaxID=29486 RepID=UPI002236FD0A|nr:hypothetical protein [Yersinia ruckeri]MCW6598735.1 hypothetical protein [Yersinia ruckeri]